MISEFCFLFKHLRLQITLANKKTIGQARGSIRGDVTTTCFWSLIETGFMQKLSVHSSVAGNAFGQTQKFDINLKRQSDYVAAEFRVRVLQQDLFKPAPASFYFSGHDLIATIDLFHGYCYEGNAQLLDLFAALKNTFTGKTFIISEVCLTDERKMTNIVYLHVEHELFHALTFQKTFKEDDLQILLREARQSWGN